MRIKLGFELIKTTIPLDYRPTFISFIKSSIEKMYPNFYNNIFKNSSFLEKGFTFSIYLQNPKIIGRLIELSEPTINMSVSLFDYATLIQFYNALYSRYKKSFTMPIANSMKLTSISILPPKIISGNSCKIKFLSPLLIKHNLEKKDIYIDFENSIFNNLVNIQIEEMIEELNLQSIENKYIDIIPINAKRTVIKFLNYKFNSSYGEYIIKGEERLLNYLYQTGIGYRRSDGFGMFEII